MKEKRLILLLLLVFGITIFGQVGFNTDEPNSNTLLHVSEKLKSTDPATLNKLKGIIIPRLTEVERDRLTYVDPNANPKVLKLSVQDNSLLIFNTTEDCYNYWNFSANEWKSLCGALGKGSFTFDCTNVKIKGAYIEGKELTQSNFLSIPITVDKAGDYTIMVTTNNGYSFFASGTFLNTGSYTIEAFGQGTPVAVQVDNLEFKVNGESITCTPDVQVNVLTAAATYNALCGNATVNGIYRTGQALGTTHFIDIPVRVTNLGSWSVTSNTVDGISFSGSGQFTTTGTTTVRVYGNGAPASISTKTLTLTTNSDGAVATNCTVDIRITIPGKKILGIGYMSNNYGYQIAAPTTTHARRMLDSQKNFGTDTTSTVSNDGFTYVSLGSNVINASLLSSQIDSAAPPDIIQIGYSVRIDPSSAEILADYARKGGVILAFTEDNQGAQNFVNALMGTSASVGMISGSGNRYALSNSTHPIVKGPFGDLSGLAWGDDGSGTTYVSGIDETQVEVLSTGFELGRGSGNTSQITSFVHKQYNVVFIGDGGFFAGQLSSYGTPTGFPVTQPFTINNQNDAQPIPNPLYGPTNASNGQGSIYNSHLFGNIFAWAIHQAETNGYNKQN